MNKVVLDNEARALFKMLKNAKGLTGQYFDALGGAFLGRTRIAGGKSSPLAIIAQNLDLSINTHVFTPLKEATKRRKTTKKMLVESGKLKKQALRKSTMRKRISGNTVTYEQTVPDYGKYHNEGGTVKGRPPKRPFFSIQRRQDNTQFQAAASNLLAKMIREKGISLK